MSSRPILVQRKFSINSQFLDTTLQKESEVREGETDEEALIRAYRELGVTADRIMRETEQDKGHLNGSDLPPHQKTQITFAPPPMPTRNIEEERKEVMDTIDRCENLEQLKSWKSQNQTVPGKILTHYNNRLQQLTK